MDGTKTATIAVSRSWWFLKYFLPNPHNPTVRRNIPLINKKKRIPLEKGPIAIALALSEVSHLNLK
jgi:hypothetical protein